MEDNVRSGTENILAVLSKQADIIKLLSGDQARSDISEVDPLLVKY